MEKQRRALREVSERLRETEQFVATKASELADERAYTQSRDLLSIAQDLARFRTRLNGATGVQPSAARFAADVAEYPQFFRRHEELVKRGLKRDKKGTYEHGVPRSRYFGIVGVIARQRPSFKSHEVIAGCEASWSYQVHIVLGYLTKEGLLRKSGRGTYSAPDAAGFPDKAHRAWEALPSEP